MKSPEATKCSWSTSEHYGALGRLHVFPDAPPLQSYMEQFTYTPLLLYSQNWRLRFAQKIISSWETLAFRTRKKTPRGILLTVKIDKICQTELATAHVAIPYREIQSLIMLT